MIIPAQPRQQGSLAERFDQVALMPHAHTGAGAVRSLSVSGVLHGSGNLTVEFDLTADLRAIRLVPAVCQPRRRDELWRNTCFELFARQRGSERYCEFNFSPCGDWAAYTFEAYRDGQRHAQQRPIAVTLRTTGTHQISLRASMDLRAAYAADPAVFRLEGWELNCAAIIEGVDGALSYWAARHPHARPDFHDGQGFAIALDGSRQAQP